MIPFAANASVLSDAAATMVAGEWKKINTGLTRSQVMQNRYDGGENCIFQYASELQWDNVNRRVIYVGGGHNTVWNRLIYYVDNNLWVNYGDINFGMGIQPYDQPAIRSIDPITIYSNNRTGDGSIAKWTDAGGWALDHDLQPHYLEAGGMPVSVEYFPETNSLILFSGVSGKLYRYPLGSDVIYIATYTGDYNSATRYSPVHKVVIFGGGAYKNVWQIDNANIVKKLADAPYDWASSRNTIITVDPISGNFLFFFGSGGGMSQPTEDKFYTFNPTNNVWTQQLWTTKPPIFQTPSSYDPSTFQVVATPISDYGVVMFAFHNLYMTGDPEVWLYKHSNSVSPDTTPPAAPTGLSVN